MRERIKSITGYTISAFQGLQTPWNASPLTQYEAPDPPGGKEQL